MENLMENKRTMLPAVAYYRYSPGGGQTEQSIEGQRRDCLAYARSHGYVIVKEYIDRHMTGRNDKRPNFQLMMHDAELHRFDTLIAWKNDRISRNRRDALNYKDQLRRCGVQIRYAEMDIPRGPEGILMESVMDGLAEYYSAELAQKIRRGMTESAHKCYALGSTPPFGLMVQDHKYVPDPATAPYVRWIFEQYASGTLITEICGTLNAKGVRTARGHEFNKNSLRVLLRNEKYIGVYEAKGIRTEDAIPPIIPRDLFYAVQQRIPQNAHSGHKLNGPRSFPLSGIAYCAICGAPLIGICGTGKSGAVHTYYACTAHKHKRTCAKKNIRQASLEKQVYTATLDYVLQPSVIRPIAKQVEALSAADNANQEEMLAVQSQLKDTTRRINNILTAMEEGDFSKAVSARLSVLESEQTRLEGQLAALRRAKPKVTASRVEFMLEKMRQTLTDLTSDQLTALTKIFLSRVDLSDDELILTYTLIGTPSSPHPITLKDTPSATLVPFPLSSQDVLSAPPERAPGEHPKKPIPMRIVASAYGFSVYFKLAG